MEFVPGGVTSLTPADLRPSAHCARSALGIRPGIPGRKLPIPTTITVPGSGSGSGTGTGTGTMSFNPDPVSKASSPGGSTTSQLLRKVVTCRP
jgi:hypothetical protein